MHPDHIPYFAFTPKSRLDKAIKSLAGIIEGISIDAEINEKELSFLSDWVRDCEDVRNKHPFNELIPVVEEALADRILTEDEKLDILWLCEKLSSKSTFYDQVTNDIQRLHGILGGILADGVVTEKELKGLSEWLMVHEDLKTCWPYDEIDSIVTAVMADQRIDESEQKTLQLLFSEFVQIEDDKTITRPPILQGQKISGLCAVSPEIKFENSVFCFTGASSRYERSELKEIVIKFGGKYTNNVAKSLDYLVIGAEGNPCWAYACYGRKVEAAVKLRKEGHKLLLVHENDFHDAVADYVAG